MQIEEIGQKIAFRTPPKQEKKEKSARGDEDGSPEKENKNQYDMSSWREANLCLWMEFDREIDRKEGKVLTGKRVLREEGAGSEADHPTRLLKRF
jgi:hypothetical protein